MGELSMAEEDEQQQNAVEPEASELSDLDLVRCEVNLLVFPFFALTRKTLHRKLRTEFRATVQRGGESVEIAWTVSADPEYGYPGLFDREVHRTVEQIITEMLQAFGRVENPIPLGSLYSFCERMGLTKEAGRQGYGGWQYREIRRALERIATATIKSEGTFYHKGERRWVAQVFHLYDAVVFRGETLRDGTTADTNYVYLGDLYLQSINSLYVKPIDFNYQRSLRPIAARLYEILGVKFYGLRNKPDAPVCFRYSTLAQLLPVTLCRYLADARKQLNPSHEELVDTGFLRKYEWQDSKDVGEWLLYYWPGERAQTEIAKASKRCRLGRTEMSALPELEAPSELASRQSAGAGGGRPQADDELVRMLVEKKVSEAVARELVASRPGELIRRWAEAVDYARARDKGAFLARAIREGWELPEEYVRAKETARPQSRLRGGMEESVSPRSRAEEERQRESHELEQLYRRLPKSDREEVDRLALER
ncbi:MAG: replication initiator protein A, partial [Armatimonadetes bacterium]|nr:replication initiator protein A [Armatimonadota bacterium]